MARTDVRYGWIPDLPDQRDHGYAAPAAVLAQLPPRVDLRPQCPPVLDQGQLGSCTANAIAGAFRFDQRRQRPVDDFAPSRLFIYYNERVIEGTVRTDAGAMLRDGIKTLAKQGVCAESTWPYVIEKFARKPSVTAYRQALRHQALAYQRVAQTPKPMQACLAEGYPFVFGFTVYESFESAQVERSGTVPLPVPGERALGGHAMLAVGYDSDAQRFSFMNSWGKNWGENGFGTIPFAYLANADLAADFWTLRTVEA